MMTDCTAVGDEVVIMIMMMLSMVMMCIALAYILRLVDCCSLYGLRYGLGWVGSWVHKLLWQQQLVTYMSP